MISFIQTATTMHRYSSFFAFAVSGLLLVTLTACDYTAQQGGMMDVRVRSTSNDRDLKKAVVTVDHIAIVSGFDKSNPRHFGDWPNMLDGSQSVDLTKAGGTDGTRLVHYRVPAGESDGLHVQFSNTAKIRYQTKDGDPVEETIQLSKEAHGKVALKLERMKLEKSEEATLYLQFDLNESFPPKEGALQFQPSVTPEVIR